MQQLADMQSRHDEAMREMEIKLQQREAAIQTLERALCLRNEAVEEVRDELDFTRAKLNDAERMIQRYVQETNQLVAARNARSASPPNGHLTRRRSREIKHAPTAAQFLSDMVHNDARSRREFSNELSRNANHASNSRALLLTR
jgi:chromosome segregation ATPase